ncbi:MAG: hypothetical protein U1B84_21140, partial [Variovorax sp.]|nr:hypothetical protein [Variovorax sp.]
PAKIATISAAIRKAVEEPVFKEKCNSLYLEPRYQGPDEFRQTMVKTTAFWKRLVSELDISPQ